jgi:hypothetical protein
MLAGYRPRPPGWPFGSAPWSGGEAGGPLTRTSAFGALRKSANRWQVPAMTRLDPNRTPARQASCNLLNFSKTRGAASCSD